MFQRPLLLIRLTGFILLASTPTGASTANARSDGYLLQGEPQSGATPSIDTILDAMTHSNGAWRMFEESSQENDVQNDGLQLWASIVAIFFATIGVLAALGACIFVYKFRSNPIVSVGQPPFLYLICFGSILMCSSTCFTLFFKGRTQTAMDKSCVAQKWFEYMGAMITYMSLFCKLWRVYKVTQFRRGQTILIKHVIAPFVVALMLAVGLLISWTIQDPPNWSSDAPLGPFDQGGTPDSFAVCVPGSDVYNFATSMLFLFSVGIALWMSWKTRHVREDISDSRRVCQSLCAHFVILILESIVSIVASLLQNPSVYFISLYFLEIVSALTTVSYLVGPKIYYVRYEQRNGHLPANLRSVVGNVHVTGVTIQESELEAATTSARTNFEASNSTFVEGEHRLSQNLELYGKPKTPG